MECLIFASRPFGRKFVGGNYFALQATIDNTNNFSKRKNSDERSYKRGIFKVVRRHAALEKV